MASLLERHAKDILGIVSCWDRVVLQRGELVITGFRHLDIQRNLPRLSSSQISRQLKRLRIHGLIKRIGRRYKYYITELGRRAVITGLKLREFFVLPQLASPATSHAFSS